MAQSAAQNGYNKRLSEITKIWQDNRWLYVIAGVLLGILVAPALEQITGNLNDLIGNLVPEAVGIVFTVLILDRLAANRSREEYKQELFRQAKSRSNDFAVDALRQIQDNDWWDVLLEHYPYNPFFGEKYRVDLSFVQWADAYLHGVNLNNTYFWRANLQRADLSWSDMRGADLRFANLQEAWLSVANLGGADLSNANLQQAKFLDTVLHGADLRFANLQQVRLNAKLQGAVLYQANLRDAVLDEDIKFDEKTVLPDAMNLADFGETPEYTRYWTPETDMSRYTDPNHPDFWQPDWVKEQKEDD